MSCNSSPNQCSNSCKTCCVLEVKAAIARKAVAMPRNTRRHEKKEKSPSARKSKRDRKRDDDSQEGASSTIVGNTVILGNAKAKIRRKRVKNEVILSVSSKRKKIVGNDVIGGKTKVNIKEDRVTQKVKDLSGQKAKHDEQQKRATQPTKFVGNQYVEGGGTITNSGKNNTDIVSTAGRDPNTVVANQINRGGTIVDSREDLTRRATTGTESQKMGKEIKITIIVAEKKKTMTETYMTTDALAKVRTTIRKKLRFSNFYLRNASGAELDESKSFDENGSEDGHTITAFNPQAPQQADVAPTKIMVSIRLTEKGEAFRRDFTDTEYLAVLRPTVASILGSQDIVMCDEKGNELDENKTFAENGVKDGGVIKAGKLVVTSENSGVSGAQKA